MKIVRGVVTKTLRLTLTLQSDDVETHAYMTDQEDFFIKLVDDMQQIALDDLKGTGR